MGKLQISPLNGLANTPTSITIKVPAIEGRQNKTYKVHAFESGTVSSPLDTLSIIQKGAPQFLEYDGVYQPSGEFMKLGAIGSDLPNLKIPFNSNAENFKIRIYKYLNGQEIPIPITSVGIKTEIIGSSVDSETFPTLEGTYTPTEQDRSDKGVGLNSKYKLGISFKTLSPLSSPEVYRIIIYSNTTKSKEVFKFELNNTGTEAGTNGFNPKQLDYTNAGGSKTANLLLNKDWELKEE